MGEVVLIVYGLDVLLVQEETQKITNDLVKQKSELFLGTYHLIEPNQEMLHQIINDINTEDLFGNAKIIIVRDYTSWLNNQELITFLEQKIISKSNKIIIELITDNLKFDNKQCKIFRVNPYSMSNLKSWILNQAKENNLEISNEAMQFIMKNFSLNLQVIRNEFQNLKYLEQAISLEIVNKCFGKYLSTTNHKLIELLLTKNRIDFWNIYRNNCLKKGYDNSSIFYLFIHKLEQLLEIKLLQKKGVKDLEIHRVLQISAFQIKQLFNYNWDLKSISLLLVQANSLDLAIKSGKTHKNIGIDLFFLNI